MRAGRLTGFLAILLLLGIGVGLVSAALPEAADDHGYYDGDGDDAAAAPQRLAVLIDLAIGSRAETAPVRAPGAFDGPALSISRPTPRQSLPPLLRSPPTA
jgi:hypothetical protein